MHRILNAVRSFLQSLLVRDCPPDPLASLSLRELADLPRVIRAATRPAAAERGSSPVHRQKLNPPLQIHSPSST